MKMLSIICCYNNKKMYENLLVKSLKKQNDVQYELIGIDNTNNKFSSAAQALNWGCQKAKNENLLFVHQDFEFMSSTALSDICQFYNKISDYDIWGAAGAIKEEKAPLLKKLIGRNRIIYSSLDQTEYMIHDYKRCESVDECCFGFKKSFWVKHNFSEEICDSWDLYAVEMCLYANCIGGNIMVIPVSAKHHSGGNLTSSFYRVLRKMSKEYKNKKSEIITPCVVTFTKFYNYEYIKLMFVNIIRKIVASKRGYR